MAAEVGDDAIAALALLREPTRRRLFEYVVASDAAVGRDAAAGHLGISRALAAFHLDQLAAAGLLDVRYRRLTGRTGPGAGRPAKLYVRARRELRASYPPREYGRAAEFFADALELKGADGRAAAVETTFAHGHATGIAARLAAGPRPVGHQRLALLVQILRDGTYEPVVSAGGDGAVRLRNCPYDALVTDHRDLVCGASLAWVQGVLDGLGDTTFSAQLAPSDGHCCVVLRPESAR